MTTNINIKNYNPKISELDSDWHLIDATDQILGRLSTNIAILLIVKNKPTYVPHLLSGDFVIVINSSKVKVSGDKYEKKIYKRFSPYPGNTKEIPFNAIQNKTPNKIIELAVKGMLPRNKLGRKMFTRLKVYSGSEHPHIAQLIGSKNKQQKSPQPFAVNQTQTSEVNESSTLKATEKKSSTKTKAAVTKSSTKTKAAVKKSSTKTKAAATKSSTKTKAASTKSSTKTKAVATKSSTTKRKTTKN